MSTSAGATAASRRFMSTSRSPGTPTTRSSRSPSGCVERHDDVLQRVAGGPGAVLARVLIIEQINKRFDRRSVGGGHLEGRGHAGRILSLGHGGGHSLGVGGIATRGRHEGVLADRRGVQELLGARAAHRTAHRGDDDVAQAQALEDALIGVALGLVRGVQTLVVECRRSKRPSSRTRGRGSDRRAGGPRRGTSSGSGTGSRAGPCTRSTCP